MKRILTAHDLSCHGTASLGVAIPVLTAFGHQVVAFPTVVLSSTTDIDQKPVVLETTDWMYKVVDRWENQRMRFDAVYTGWLGDPRQIDLIMRLCQNLCHDKTIIFVDPVLGDSGALYPSQEELSKIMSRLVAEAQVITPNPTEAALLLNKQPREYGVGKDGTVSPDQADELVKDLAEKYPRVLSIVKSVVKANQIGVCVRFTPDNTHSIKKSATKLILEMRTNAPPIGGSGDLFASLLIGRWLEKNVGIQGDAERKLAIIRSVVKTISDVMGRVKYQEIKDLSFRNLLHIN